MLKRSDRSSSSSSAERPTPKRSNKQKSKEMEGNQETDSPLISMEILLDKLIAIESRMEDNFTNLHSQISELTNEFKHEINVVKSTMIELEKSVNHAWATIEDLQQESKALKDSKSSHQKMMDEQTVEIQGLKADLKKLQAENEMLKPALKEAQENLVALENYTRRENLRFMNIPENRGENCQDIIYDVLENDLKMNVEKIRFHAVHRVGKAQHNGATPARPRPIIARFVVREDKDAVFKVKNRLKSSARYGEAYITQDFARAIQKERKTLIQSMFAAKQAGRDAKVVNRSLFIDNSVFDISNIPVEFQVART